MAGLRLLQPGAAAGVGMAVRDLRTEAAGAFLRYELLVLQSRWSADSYRRGRLKSKLLEINFESIIIVDLCLIVNTPNSDSNID